MIMYMHAYVFGCVRYCVAYAVVLRARVHVVSCTKSEQKMRRNTNKIRLVVEVC